MNKWISISTERHVNFEKSINFYEKTIKLDPTNYNAHSNLGHVYKELKKYNKSLYYYKKAVELEPNLIAAHYNLGLIFNVLRKYSEAISSYKKALEVTGTLSKIIRSSIYFLLLVYLQFEFLDQLNRAILGTVIFYAIHSSFVFVLLYHTCLKLFPSLFLQ